MVEKKPEQKTLKSKKYGGEYIIGETLGKGAQAEVFKFYKNSGENQGVYATKRTNIEEYLNTPDKKRNEKRWKAIVRELCILESLNSIHVVAAVEFIKTTNNLYLV
jgi:serine/threonine protein kinase